MPTAQAFYEKQCRHAVYYCDQLRAAKEFYLQGGIHIQQGLALFDLEWPNIQAGQAWAAAQAVTDDAAAQLCSVYPDAGANVLRLRQVPSERLRWLQAALQTARRLNQRRLESKHLGSLGLTVVSTNHCENLSTNHC